MRIIRLKKTLGSDFPRIPTRLLGDLGELYVMVELQRREYSPELKAGQSGFDIFEARAGKRIEVRTSLLKNEGLYPNGINFYGWRVENREQKKDNKYDFLVCVSIPPSFRKPRFFIFTKEEAFKVGDVSLGRFGTVKKKIHFFENSACFKRARSGKPKHVTQYERYINDNPHKFENCWNKIPKN